MIPNTTPTPNELFNGEMNKMNDTELRVVLVVTRATLGWVINKETGMRKEEDWISQKQLIEKTGRSNRAISTAISSCIKNGWVEARDKNGQLLLKSEERARRKVFYRLGRIFLDKLSTGEETSQDKSDEVIVKSGELNDINLVKKLHNTKEILTKETIQKISKQDLPIKERKDQIIFDLIELFKAVNPTYERFFKNKTERASLENLIKKFGREKIKNMIKVLPKIFGKPYAPRITSPYQLEKKLADLIAYLQSEKSKGGQVFTIKPPQK